MAARVYVAEMNGASWSKGNMTLLSGNGVGLTARYCTTDAAQPAQTFPIPIPDSGHNPSYVKTHFLWISGTTSGGGGTNTFTYVSSIRWYADNSMFNWGSTKASGVVLVGSGNSSYWGVASGSYSQATGTQGTSGQYLTDLASIDGSSNVESFYDLDHCLTVDERKIVPNDTAQFVYSKALLHQCWVGANASSGNPGTETFTWVWDEVS